MSPPSTVSAAIDHAPISATLHIASGKEPEWLTVPARPGVAIFESDESRTTLIATTADLRNLARTRLADAARTDHRAITRRVLVIEAGSSLEADVIYLAQARVRLPELHRLVSERWRAWFVHVDPAAEFPQWTRTDLTDSSAPSGRVLGPFADKESAGRFIERIIDAFDLCREHHLLVQAPRARACPYKEMGRCAAPCDGSEPMPSYRTRVARAAGLIVRGMPELRAALEADMMDAARAGEYERAAELKQQFARIDGLIAGTGSGHVFACLGDLAEWRLVIVVPAVRQPAKRARVLLVAGARLWEIGELSARATEPELAPICDRLLGTAAHPHSHPAPIRPDQAQLDTLGAVSRWLHLPASKRRGAAVRITPGMTTTALSAELAAAAAVACRPRKGAAGGLATDQVMERVGAHDPPP